MTPDCDPELCAQIVLPNCVPDCVPDCDPQLCVQIVLPYCDPQLCAQLCCPIEVLATKQL